MDLTPSLPAKLVPRAASPLETARSDLAAARKQLAGSPTYHNAVVVQRARRAFDEAVGNRRAKVRLVYARP